MIGYFNTLMMNYIIKKCAVINYDNTKALNMRVSLQKSAAILMDVYSSFLFKNPHEFKHQNYT